MMSNLPVSYLIYFIINKLHGDATRMTLPYGGFEWVSEHNIYDIDIQNLKDGTGWIPI